MRTEAGERVIILNAQCDALDAHIAGVDAITTAHLAEALQYRPRRVDA